MAPNVALTRFHSGGLSLLFMLALSRTLFSGFLGFSSLFLFKLDAGPRNQEGLTCLPL